MTRDVWEVARRRKWLIVAPLVLIFLLPAAAALVLTRNYVSTGTLHIVPNEVVRPIVATLDATQVDRTRLPVDDAMDSAKLVVGSRTYLTQIAIGAGLEAGLQQDPDKTLATLKRGTSITAEGPELLAVSFTGSNPLVAQHIVQTELEVLKQVRAERVRADGQQAVALFTGQVADYAKNLGRATAALQTLEERHPEVALTDTQKAVVTQLSILRAQLGQLTVQEQSGKALSPAAQLRKGALVDQIDALSVQVGASPAIQLERLRLEEERTAAQSDLETATKQLDAARLLAAVHTGIVQQDRILDRASLPTRSTYGKTLTLAALAFILASATAASLVMLAEYLDTQVRRPGDVLATAGIPVLAVVDDWRRSG